MSTIRNESTANKHVGKKPKKKMTLKIPQKKREIFFSYASRVFSSMNE
jgi:hypothetical protein